MGKAVRPCALDAYSGTPRAGRAGAAGRARGAADPPTSDELRGDCDVVRAPSDGRRPPARGGGGGVEGERDAKPKTVCILCRVSRRYKQVTSKHHM